MIRMQTENVIAHAVARGSNNRANNRGNGEFGDLMARSASEAMAARPENRDNPRSEAVNNNNNDSQQSQATQNSQETQGNVSESTQEQVASEISEMSYVAYADAVITDVVIDEDALLAEMAAILGITLEQLSELLAELDMSVEELLEVDNRLELLMAAKGLESHAELANYPEALPMVQKLAQAIDTNVTTVSYASPAEAQTAVTTEGELLETVETISQVVQTTSSQTTNTQAITAQASEIAMQNTGATVQIENTPLMVAIPTAIDAPVTTTASVADTAAPIPMQNITPQNIVNQIVSNVRLFTGEGMTEIRIKLTPAQLGDLSMRIATINGLVTAQFIADSQRVKELIEAGLNMLRDSLEEAGIIVQDIEVNVRGEGGFHDFENETEISDSRIRELMAQGELEEIEEQASVATEDNLVDYRV